MSYKYLCGNFYKNPMDICILYSNDAFLIFCIKYLRKDIE